MTPHTIDNQVALRYRFQEVYQVNKEDLLIKFRELKKKSETPYPIKILDHHIWLYIPLINRRIYSPHLHLQLESNQSNSTRVRALFGPHPTLWTMYIFFHFLVAISFLFLGVVGYSKFVLKEPYRGWLYGMFAMVVLWFFLYGIARLLRNMGLRQAKELFEFYKKIINE